MSGYCLQAASDVNVSATVVGILTTSGNAEVGGISLQHDLLVSKPACFHVSLLSERITCCVTCQDGDHYASGFSKEGEKGVTARGYVRKGRICY